jgi:hypothetical protein
MGRLRIIPVCKFNSTKLFANLKKVAQVATSFCRPQKKALREWFARQFLSQNAVRSGHYNARPRASWELPHYAH